MDVFFYEAFSEEAERLKEHLTPELRADFSRETIQEHTGAKPPAPVIAVRTQSVIPARWAGQLEGILTRSTGYDHLKAYLSANDPDGKIPAGYLPLYCNRAVAEQAMLLWMALLRKLPRQRRQFRTFDRDYLTGREAEGRCLVVVGVGNIGHEVAVIGKGLGMRVLGVDIERTHEDVIYRPAEEALPQADIVVCAMSLTPETRTYFDEERLRMLPPGAVFVNVSRGECSPCAALLKLMEEGHLGGVALDVFNEEANLSRGLRGGHFEETAEVRAAGQLGRRDDVIFTPHNAFNTHEAVGRKARQSVEQLEHLRINGRFLWSLP
jgi:D-lactate dehydrogenase